MTELTHRVDELRNRIDRVVGNVTGKKAMLFVTAKEIGYPDVNQLNPSGDLTLAIITQHPDELLETFDREAIFLMTITDEYVIQSGGRSDEQWKLITKEDKGKNPYSRSGFFKKYEFSSGLG